jgi:hypothetical protein
MAPEALVKQSAKRRAKQRKMITIRTMLPGFLVLLTTGCISPQSYVAPGMSSATYDDLGPVAEKLAVSLEVEFWRNGQRYPNADQELRVHVERTLVASGVFTLASQQAEKRIKVITNNIGNVDDAWSKGFKAGLTLGAAGSLLKDAYEFTIEYDDGMGTGLHREYKQELYTAIGDVDPPFENVEPTSPAHGFAIMVERTLLEFIRELQVHGQLSLRAAYRQKFAGIIPEARR